MSRGARVDIGRVVATDQASRVLRFAIAYPSGRAQGRFAIGALSTPVPQVLVILTLVQPGTIQVSVSFVIGLTDGAY